MAVFTAAEFDRLRREYADQASFLDTNVADLGGRKVIDLARMDGAGRHETGTALYDRLYRQSYANASFLRSNEYSSYYHQLREILQLPKSRVASVLEVGVGGGILKSLVTLYDYAFYALDIIAAKRPDIAADVHRIPLKDGAVDLACAFQVLEHMPYEGFPSTMREMARVARNYVFISLPSKTNSIQVRLKATFYNRFVSRLSQDLNLFVKLPTKRTPDAYSKDDPRLNRGKEDKHNPHYWEVNWKSYPKDRILADVRAAGLKVVKDFHNPQHAYHWFLLCEKA